MIRYSSYNYITLLHIMLADCYMPCSERLADRAVLKKIVVFPMQNMGSTLEQLSQMKIMSLIQKFKMT